MVYSSTTPLQIFFKSMFNSKIIFISIISPDDNCQRKSASMNGLSPASAGMLASNGTSLSSYITLLFIPTGTFPIDYITNSI